MVPVIMGNDVIPVMMGHDVIPRNDGAGYDPHNDGAGYDVVDVIQGLDDSMIQQLTCMRRQ
jgi:hypothetical protein